MAYKVCSRPGCHNIFDGTGRCADCKQVSGRARRASNAPYKTKGHQGFRLAVLDRDPLCVNCHIRPSTDADHYPKDRPTLVALGFDPNDPVHGRGLCHGCHSTSTAQEQPGGWNMRDE